MTTKNVNPKWGYIVVSLIVILDFVFIIVGTRNPKSGFYLPPSLLIPLVGLLTFLGMLIALNLFSPEFSLNKGEIRGAIASSLLVVYFFLITVTLFASASPLGKCELTIGSTETTTPATDLSQSTNPDQPSDAETAQTMGGACTTVNNLLDGYTKLMIAVVAFYFGGRSVEEAAKNASNRNSDTETPVTK